MVGADEILDPSYDGRRAHVVAIFITFQVDHARESYAVTGPTPAVREEEYRLGAAGAYVWVGVMVAPADEASVGGTYVVTREVCINQICAFCGLLVLAVVKGQPVEHGY